MAAFESLAGHQRDRDQAEDFEVPEPAAEIPPGKRTLIEHRVGTTRPDDRASDMRNLRKTLQAMQGGGAPLPAGLAAEYSRLLGADLFAVRVHTSGPASEAAALLGARAFTHGSQIAFAPGEYDPSSPRTKHVLAHELVHVVQNLRAGTAMELAARLDVGPSGSEIESEAEAGAHALVTGSAFAVSARSTLPAISLFSGNESISEPEPNQSIDPNAAGPNQSIDPNASNASEPNQSIDPNASEPNQSIDPNASGPNQSVDPNAGQNQSVDPNAGQNQSVDPSAGATGTTTAGPQDAGAGEGGAGPTGSEQPTETAAPKSIDSRIAEILEQRADPTAKSNYQKGLGQVHALRLQSLQYSFQPSGFAHTLFQTLVFPTDAISDHWAQIYSANAYRGGTGFLDGLQATIEGLRGVLHILGDLCSIISSWAGMVAVVSGLIALIGAETGVLAVVGGIVAAIADAVAITFALAKMLLDLIDMLIGVIQMLILILRARFSKDPSERARFAQLLKKEAGDFASNVVGLGAQLAVMVVTAGVGTGMTKGLTGGAKGVAQQFGKELGKLLLPSQVLAPFAKMQFRTAFRGLTGNMKSAVAMSAPGKGVKVAGGVRIPGAAQGAEGVLGISVLKRAANGRVTKAREVIPFTTKNQMNGARVQRINAHLKKTAYADAGGVATIVGTGQLIVQTKQPDPAALSRPSGPGALQVPDKPSGALTTVLMWPSQLEAMTAAKAPLPDAISRMKDQKAKAAEQAGPEIAAQVDAKLKEISDRRAKQTETATNVSADADAGKQNSEQGAEQAGKGKETKAKADTNKKKIDDEQKKVQNEGGKLKPPPPKDGVLGKLYNVTIGKIGSWIGGAQNWIKNFLGKGLMMAAGFDKADLDLAGIENDMRTDATKDEESQQAAEDVAAQDSEVQQAVYKLMEGKDSDQQAAIQGMAESQAFIDALVEADKVLDEAIKNGQIYMEEAAPIIQHELEVQTEGKPIDGAYVAPILGYADAFINSISDDNTGEVAQNDANAVLDEMHRAFEGLDVTRGKNQVASLVSSFKTARTTGISQAKSSAQRIKTAVNAFVGTCDYTGVAANAQALDDLVAEFDKADEKLIDDLYAELNKVIAAHAAAIDAAIQACPDDATAAPPTGEPTAAGSADTEPAEPEPNMTPAEPNVTPAEPNMTPADQSSSPATAPGSSHSTQVAPITRKADGGAIASDVDERLRAAASSAWSPLPPDLRAKFEATLGADLSDVRIHTGAESAAAAQAVGAHAYTAGNDIHFGAGKFDPSAREGLELLGHELAHVVQQRQGQVATAVVQGKGGIVTDEALEAEADAIGARAAAGGRPPHSGTAERRGHASDVGGLTAGSAIQRKVGPDTEYAPVSVVWSGPIAEDKLPRGLRLTWKLKGQVSVKRPGAFGRSDKLGPLENDLRIGSNAAALEIDRLRKRCEAKLQSTVVKNVTRILNGDPLDLGVDVTVKVENKALEATLSTGRLDLKLATTTVVIEGDFSKWVDQQAQIKAQMQLELAFGVELAKHALELAEAARDQLTVTKYEAKLEKVRRRVALLDGGHVPRTAPDGPSMDPKQLAKHRKELQRELDQLRGMRGKMNQLRETALEKMKTAAQKLDTLPGGKLVNKVGAKALAVVFKKFIPIYNAISTAQDVYGIVSHLAGLDWSAIGRKIIDGGSRDGEKTVLGDGSEREPGASGSGGGAVETNGGDELGDAASFQRELDAKENVELHPSAAAVLGSLLVKETIAGKESAPIPDDEKRLLNMAIPEDLTDDEIDEMSTLVASQGSTPRDRVSAVIEALQIVRPNGERKVKTSAETESDGGDHGGIGATQPQHGEPGEPERSENATRPKRRKPPRPRVPARLVVDPAETLRRLITVDERTGKGLVPRVVDFPGFRARVVVTHVAQMSFPATGEGEPTFMAKVTLDPLSEPPAGVMLLDGRSIKVGSSYMVVVDGIRPHRTQLP